VLKLAGGDALIIERARGVIERQVRHVTTLIDDLLEVSRIAEGKLTLDRRRIDVRDCIVAAVETTRAQLESRQQELQLELGELPLIVLADSARITQVMVNLLSNAAKYGKPGRSIEVRAAAVDGGARISVRDHGIGIPKDMLDEIFEPLKQLDEHLSFADRGLGLGLALVRSLVTLHGGSVRAFSDGPGHGSEFVVLLPLAR
jgi:signal transduction histidine kinase